MNHPLLHPVAKRPAALEILNDGDMFAVVRPLPDGYERKGTFCDHQEALDAARMIAEGAPIADLSHPHPSTEWWTS